MDNEKIDKVRQLEHVLGYNFNEINLLIQALTHKSFSNERPSEGHLDNERFEFLGDAILGLVISEYLFKSFPEKDEGFLSKIRARIVSGNTLAKFAAELGIGPYLYLGKGEELTDGRRKSSILTTAIEAIIAAVYLDSNYNITYNIIIDLFSGKIKEVYTHESYRDYKSELQELTQTRRSSIPVYTLIKEIGPAHKKTFEMEVLIDGNIRGIGIGTSKKEAEQKAAKDLVCRFEDEDGDED